MAYKVKALSQGYYDNKICRAEKVFFIKKPKEFSSVWMKSLDTKLDEAIKADPKLWARHKENLAGGAKSKVKVLPTVKNLEPPPHEDVEPEAPAEDDEAPLEDAEPSEGHDSDAVI
jgi:hypothetical protein